MATTSFAFPGDISGDATTSALLVAGGATTGAIEELGDRDWFAINLVAGQAYRFDLVGNTGGGGTLTDPILAVYNPSSTELASNDDAVGDTYDSRLIFVAPTTDRYYVATGGFGDALGSYTLSAQVAQDPATAEDDFFSGTPDNDTFNGDLGDDILFAGEGDDTLSGGVGIDLLGGDIEIPQEILDVLGDLSTPDGSAFLIAGYLLLDDLLGDGGFDDILVGPEALPIDLLFGDGFVNAVVLAYTLLAEVLNGSNGADSLDGGAGDDLLIGDFFTGAAGNDYLAGGAGQDVLLGDAMWSTAGGNDRLVGGDGADVLQAGRGNDLLEAGATDTASDVYLGGAGVDTLSFAGAAGGVTVALNVVGPQNTGGGGIDTISGVENLRGTSHADVLIGNGLSNTLEGGSGRDVLQGGFGDDRLVGGFGSDVLRGGAGADTHVFTRFTGADRVFGFTDGLDLLEFTGFGVNFDTAGEVIAAAQQVGTDTRIILANPGAATSSVIFIVGLQLANLDATDFALIA